MKGWLPTVMPPSRHRPLIATGIHAEGTACHIVKDQLSGISYGFPLFLEKQTTNTVSRWSAPVPGIRFQRG
jgi:hypothetical protein